MPAQRHSGPAMPLDPHQVLDHEIINLIIETILEKNFITYYISEDILIL